MMAHRHAPAVTESSVINTDCSAESEDEEPLANMKRKVMDQSEQPESDGKKKKTKRGALTDEDSNDGSRSKGVKRTPKGSLNEQTKASASEIRATTSKQARKAHMPESEDDSSMNADDEPHLKLKTSVKSPAKQKTSPQSKRSLKRSDKLLKECSSDTDDEPLSKKKRLKVQLEVTYSSDGKKTKRRGSKLRKDHSAESTDDEPLAKKRTGLKTSNKKSKSTPKRSLLKVNDSEHSAESADDEPLTKRRTRLKASDNKKSKSTPGRNLLKVNYAEDSAESAEGSAESADDEPLAKRRTKLKASDNKKPKSTHGRNLLKVNYAESSSDNEPLSKMKIRTKAPAECSTDSKKIKPEHEDKFLKELSGEELDDKPQANVGKNTRRGASKSNKASASKMRVTTSKLPRKTPVPRSKSNRSGDETLLKAAHPEVTMDLKVCLMRCSVEADPSGDVNKSQTAEPPNAQGPAGTKCLHSEESAEET